MTHKIASRAAERLNGRNGINGRQSMRSSRRVWATGVGLAIAGAVLAGAAGAQPKPEARAAVLQKLTDCRKVTDGATRLACYDDATASLEQAEAKGDIVVVDREQARSVRRQAFGFSLPSISLFERGEKPEDLSNVSGQVESARLNRSGKWVVKLTDGAVWEQTDTTPVARAPKAGMQVKIRKAALGSFFMNLGGQTAVRARRVE